MKNLEKFDFFDENFFLYLEEMDLCKRVRLMNTKIFIDPFIKVEHFGGTSHESKINKPMELSRNWHWMWSTFYYHKKYYGFLLALLIVSRKFFSALFKVIIYSILFNQNKKKIYFQRLSGLFNSIIGKKSFLRPEN